MGSAIASLLRLLDHDPAGILHHIQFGLAEMRVRFLTLGFSFFNLLLTLIEPVSCAVERFSDDVEAIAAEPDTELAVGNHELLRGKQFGVEFLQSSCFFPLAADAIEQVCSLTHGYSPQAERRASSLMVYVVVMRVYVWIALSVALGGLILWGGWYQRRRAWSTHKQDETMRRHVNRNY